MVLVQIHQHHHRRVFHIVLEHWPDIGNLCLDLEKDNDKIDCNCAAVDLKC